MYDYSIFEMGDTIDKVHEKSNDVKDKVGETSKDIGDTANDITTTSSPSAFSVSQEKKYEGNGSNAEIGKIEDPLTEYRKEEPITLANIKENEPANGIIASSSAISSAAGLPLPATSPSASTTRPSPQRQDVVEVAADGVGRPGHAERLDAGRVEGAARQHRLLDLAGDFEVVLQRQPVGHLEQHQQVDQQEAGQQPQRAGGEDRVRDAAAAGRRGTARPAR